MDSRLVSEDLIKTKEAEPQKGKKEEARGSSQTSVSDMENTRYNQDVNPI